MASGGTRLLKPLTNKADVTTMRALTNRVNAARQWGWDPERIAAAERARDAARAVIVLRALLGELPAGLSRATKTEMIMMIMAVPEPDEGDADVPGPTAA